MTPWATGGHGLSEKKVIDYSPVVLGEAGLPVRTEKGKQELEALRTRSPRRRHKARVAARSRPIPVRSATSPATTRG